MMDGLKLSIPQRMVILRVVLIFSLVVSIVLSPHLWGGYRTFPYAPLVHQNVVQPPFDCVFTILSVLCLLASLFLKGQRVFIFIALALNICLALLDVNRLQPWFFLYNSLLAVFIFYNGRVDAPNKFTSIFIILQLIFASVYFFSGISQLNSRFVHTVFEDLISPLRLMMSERQFMFFKKVGHISPYIFMLIGLGFTISPLRYIAISLALCVHLLLLIFLFPSVKNGDYALWFGNLSFMAMLLLLFSGKTKQRYFSPTFLFKMPLFYAVAALFLVMPFFNTVNRWPDYLSWNFRSGNNNTAIITISPSAKAQLPLYLQHFCESKNGTVSVNFDAWSQHELQASAFPGRRVFSSVHAHLLYLTGTGVKDLQLQIVPKQKLLYKP